ncbi:MAG TPA: alpha/beta fold hydrolase [Candidatus Acidoferrales bacterium]|nr:alpha/beta fold hydrolase [Candidatus Acidoferrales bacterium]
MTQKLSLFILALFLCIPIAANARPSSSQVDQKASEEKFLQANGVKLYYEECGSGGSINVALLHDGLLHSATWDEVWPLLCAKYHVVRYDRRGYGRSDSATAPFAPEEDLLQIMRAVKMERAILIGNSSGVGLALDFALAHPQMVEGMLLIGPVVHGMSSSAYFTERGNRANAPMAQNDVKSAAENWSRDPYLISGAKPEARKKLLDLLEQYPQNLKTGGQFETRPSPPTVLRLAQIEAPTLVLVGDADIADVIAYAGAIEAELPISFFEVWKDAGHLIQLEWPAKIVERFSQFAALADRKETNLPAEAIRDYAGEYKFFNRTIGISLKGNHLALRLPDLPEKPLFAATQSRFFVRTTPTEFEFERDDAGKVKDLVIFNSDGNKIVCERIG